jgi:hypothetical protein
MSLFSSSGTTQVGKIKVEAETWCSELLPKTTEATDVVLNNNYKSGDAVLQGSSSAELTQGWSICLEGRVKARGSESAEDGLNTRRQPAR